MKRRLRGNNQVMRHYLERPLVVGCSTDFTPILLDFYRTNMSEIKNSKPVRLMHHDSIFNTVVTEVPQSLRGHMTVSNDSSSG